MHTHEGVSREIRKRRAKNARYGARHHRTKDALRPVVAAGLAVCARCGRPIEPGTPWDLGHDDLDPSRYAGPEHRLCNQTAPHRTRTSRAW